MTRLQYDTRSKRSAGLLAQIRCLPRLLKTKEGLVMGTDTRGMAWSRNNSE